MISAKRTAIDACSVGVAAWKGQREYEYDSTNAISLASGGMLALVLIFPLWNAAILLSNAMYIFFIGQVVALALIVGCLMVVVSYVVAMRLQAQSIQSKTTISSTATMLIGLLLMFCGNYFSVTAGATAEHVIGNCDFSEAVSLVATSTWLHALQRRPECAAKTTVELCDGFQDTPQARALRTMEMDLRCTGFCNDQTWTDDALEREGLFGKAKYRMPCQWMLARELSTVAKDLGEQTYYEGCMLIFVAIMMGVFTLRY